MADMELRQAFANLQKKMLENRAQAKMADMQIAQFERDRTRAKYTMAEIETLRDESRFFQSCGRMFILRSRNEIEEILKNDQNTCESKIKDLEAKKVYLEKSVKESEGNLREMVEQRRK